MGVISKLDDTPGYEGFRHVLCSYCYGVVEGFVHPGEHQCQCGIEDKNNSRWEDDWR